MVAAPKIPNLRASPVLADLGGSNTCQIQLVKDPISSLYPGISMSLLVHWRCTHNSISSSTDDGISVYAAPRALECSSLKQDAGQHAVDGR